LGAAASSRTAASRGSESLDDCTNGRAGNTHATTSGDSSTAGSDRGAASSYIASSSCIAASSAVANATLA
tara:strand:- start:185 stop:394 length:210 start_codon:yes stop_codon:yes gene_type:complete